MAKISDVNDEKKSPPSLLKPKDEVAKLLQARIDTGKKIQTDDDFFTWTEYNKALLNKIFSNDVIAQEYEFDLSGPLNLGDYEDDRIYPSCLPGNIRKLTSIIKRLELMDDPATATLDETPKDELSAKPNNKVFIVHGHDEVARELTARLISDLKLEPIILHEQASLGKSVLGKIEKHGNVGFAVVLLTPDDEGYEKGKPDTKQFRARQNVIFELGYFIGRIKRKNVVALYKEGVETPSDYGGICYIPMDPPGAWRYKVADELKAAGFVIDKNHIK